MPARVRPQLPSGHGELLTRPNFAEWARLATENAEKAARWDFSVAGRPVQELRDIARREMLTLGNEYSARLGVPLRPPGSSGLAIATGHQPELYHTGVWVKDFLLQRIADELDADAVDFVVDSDAFDTLALTAPCLLPEVRRCKQYLAVGSADGCYATAPLPNEKDVDEFCRIGDEMLATLPAPAVRHHFADFCSALRSARPDAETLADLVTIARRRFEAPAGTDYLELPVTRMASGEVFSAFVSDVIGNAGKFVRDYNAELHEYRSFSKTRSSLQPFPDLSIEGDRLELPFWILLRGSRRTLSMSEHDSGVALYAEDELVAEAGSADAVVKVIAEAGGVLAPKALALTLFVRLFCCDLFIHGVGGGRYDRVTDGVCRRYYGVEPPHYAVASLTMYLPLGAHIITEEEVSAARERLNRLEHNPNEVLGEVEFDSVQERQSALNLARDKSGLVERISQPDADKKALGQAIRRVNRDLAELLAPLKEHWEAELRALESQRAASEVFTDRGYPFCLWSPHEVADKAR